MTKLRILLVEDHAIVREGLKLLINGEPDMEVAGDAEDARTALAIAKAAGPDLAVVDIVLPDMSGTVLTERLLQEVPGIRILALTAQQDLIYVRQVMAAGACGYILKLTKPPEFLQAIRTVGAGGIYVDPCVARKSGAAAITPMLTAVDGRRSTLTNRDVELIQLFARGYSNREIAARMDVTVKTVETYKSRVMEKLGLQSRVQLIRFAIHQGWLSATEVC